MGVIGVKDEEVAFLVADEGVAKGVVEEFMLVGQEGAEGAGEVDEIEWGLSLEFHFYNIN